MPKLSCFYLFISGCIFASCGVQEIVSHSGLPPAAEDTSSLRIASRADEFLLSLSPQTYNGAVVLEKEGRLVTGNGYGYAWYNQKLPFTVRTVSSTAHLARQFTAASVLKLQAAEKLNLNDSLGRFFEKIPPEFQGIRLNHLLQNTSGLPYDLPDPEVAKSKKAFLEAVWNLSLVSAPGKEFHYSEVAYRLLAAVTEAAGGTDYESFLRQEILIPAGMYNTGYVLPDYQQALHAKSKPGEEEEEFLYIRYRKEPQDLWHILGSSGMLSNSEDLFLWMQAIFKANLFPAYDLQLIRAASITDQENVPAFGWLAASESGAVPLVHNSSQHGFLCQLMYLPKQKISLVLLANQVNGQVENLGSQLVRLAMFPYYVPSPLPYSGKKLVRIPQEGEAEHVRALLAYVQDSTALKTAHLVTQHFSSGFRSQLPESNHHDALGMLRQRLVTARLEKAEQKLPFYLFTFFSPEAGYWFRLRVQVDPQQSFRINTIGLETADALN